MPGFLYAFAHRGPRNPDEYESPCQSCSGRGSREACGSDPRCPPSGDELVCPGCGEDVGPEDILDSIVDEDGCWHVACRQGDA